MESHGVLSFTVVYILTDALTVPIYIDGLASVLHEGVEGVQVQHKSVS